MKKLLLLTILFSATVQASHLNEPLLQVSVEAVPETAANAPAQMSCFKQLVRNMQYKINDSTPIQKFKNFIQDHRAQGILHLGSSAAALAFAVKQFPGTVAIDFGIHGLAEAMNKHTSKLPFVTKMLGAGLIGLKAFSYVDGYLILTGQATTLIPTLSMLFMFLLIKQYFSENKPLTYGADHKLKELASRVTGWQYTQDELEALDKYTLPEVVLEMKKELESVKAQLKQQGKTLPDLDLSAITEMVDLNSTTLDASGAGVAIEMQPIVAGDAVRAEATLDE